MNKGDTIKIILNYTVDGEPITESFDGEIEFTIADKRYLKSTGWVYWDDTERAFCVSIPQSDSLSLPKASKYQVRFRNSEGAVVSSGIETLALGDVLSRKTI